MRALALLGTLALVGCFSPKYKSGQFKCGNGPRPCPDGYYCAANNTCWAMGSMPNLDMTSGPADMAEAGGDAQSNVPTDMAQPPSLSYPPAAVWITSGGGSPTATNGDQLNLSLEPSIVGGTITGSNNSQVTLGFFSSDTY